MLQQVNPNGYTEHSKLAHILVSFSQYVQNYQFTPTYPSRPTGLYATYVSFRYTHTHTMHTRRIRHLYGMYRHPRPVQTPTRTACRDIHPQGLYSRQPVRRLQTSSRTISTTDTQAYCLYTHPRPVQAPSRTASKDTHRYGHSPVRPVQTSTYTSITDTCP